MTVCVGILICCTARCMLCPAYLYLASAFCASKGCHPLPTSCLATNICLIILLDPPLTL